MTASSGTPKGRILHLIDTGGPGGAETVFLDLVCGLQDAGWGCVPVVPEEDWLADALRSHGFKPHLLASLRSLDAAYLAKLRRLAGKYRIDIVQTHLLSTAVYATIASLGTGRPVISTFHGLPDIRLERGVRQIKFLMLGHFRNQVVFVSEALRRHFQESTTLRTRNTHVVYNGIDCEVFRPGSSRAVRERLNLPADAPLVGAIGNVRPSKAYDTLLQAFAHIRGVMPKARLLIAGEAKGALFASLEALTARLGLSDAVTFLGFCDDVAELLRALDVFVLSSSDEGFSLSTVQAMATGLPVVATRCGGPVEIVEHGVSGLLVPVGRPHELSTAVVRILRSPDLGKQLGARARTRVERSFSRNAMISAYDKLYARYIAAGHRSQP